MKSMHHQRGVSLVEVLVSVVILAIGLLGAAALQSIALRGGHSSLQSTQAIIQTTSIIEAIRANSSNASSYNQAALQCTVPTGGNLSQNDLHDWIQSLHDTIGGGNTTCGQVTGCPNACVITVQWDDQRAGGSATRQIVTGARI